MANDKVCFITNGGKGLPSSKKRLKIIEHLKKQIRISWSIFAAGNIHCFW